MSLALREVWLAGGPGPAGGAGATRAPVCQSRPVCRRVIMRLLPLLLAVLTHPIHPAYVTNTPSFAAKLDAIYEKLERLTVAPPLETKTESKVDQWYHKLQKLNSLTPDNFYLSDEDEDLLVAMQSWGRLSADQLDGVAKELQRIRDEGVEDRSEYADMDDNDDVSTVTFHRTLNFKEIVFEIMLYNINNLDIKNMT